MNDPPTLFGLPVVYGPVPGAPTGGNYCLPIVETETADVALEPGDSAITDTEVE